MFVLLSFSKNPRPIRYFVLVILFSYSWQLSAQDCDCQEYLYLNEPFEDATLKFEINADGSLTEIINPNTTNGHWQEGTTLFPHGGAIDQNGFVYVGNFPENGTTAVGGVDKYDCSGNLVQADFIPAASGNGTDGSSGFATNIYVSKGILYMNAWVHSGYSSGQVFAYELCTGDMIGSYNICDDPDGLFWGFHIDEMRNQIIVNRGGQGIFIGDLDADLNGACIPLAFPTQSNRGVTRDAAGCFYVRGFTTNILEKYSPTGSLVWQTDISTANGGAGTANDGFGLVYSEDTGYLYVAGDEPDCIAVFDAATGAYVMQGAPNPPGGAPSKELTIVKECCPNQAELTFTETVCSNGNGEEIFLQDIFDCGTGGICEGEWTVETANANQVYNDCNRSIIVNGAGCATYVIEKTTAASTSAPCDPFKITLEVCTEAPTATLTPSAGTCTNGIVNDDASIAITANGASTEANYSTGSSYTGPSFGDASNINISSGGGTISGLSHTTQYTVRVFGSAGCFVDYTITTPDKSCCPDDNCVQITATKN